MIIFPNGTVSVNGSYYEPEQSFVQSVEELVDDGVEATIEMLDKAETSFGSIGTALRNSAIVLVAGLILVFLLSYIFSSFQK